MNCERKILVGYFRALFERNLILFIIAGMELKVA